MQKAMQLGPSMPFYLVSDLADIKRGSFKETTLVDGRACQTADGLFREFAAKVPFPSYFGHNWPAFAECLGERDLLSDDWSWEIIITNAELLLADDLVESDAFYRALQGAARNYSVPIQQGEWWDRNVVEFCILFQVPQSSDKGALLKSWIDDGRLRDY